VIAQLERELADNPPRGVEAFLDEMTKTMSEL